MQLPKTVIAGLQRSSLPEHPDPDLLTALVERTLLGTEREQVLGHLAGCAECRQVIALAASELAPDSAPQLAAGRSPWLRSPVIRWGALAACLVVVAAAVLVHRGQQPSPGEKTEIAMQGPTPAIPATPAPEESKQLAAGHPSVKAKAAATRNAPTPALTSIPQQVASANTGKMAAPGSLPPGSPNTMDTMQKSGSVSVQAEAVAPEPASGPRADQQLRARNSLAAAKAAPAFAPRPTTETAASTIGGAAKLTDFRAPKWQLSNNGLPERSFTAGQWEEVQIDHKNGFRALAALGMEVWVGGPAGLLYHSEDMGLNWTRMIPVTGNSTLTDDITAIAFADRLHGKVTTAGGQTWVTSDAGKTWETR
jgi:Photosynthesis system II assembly factor YCF48/Putative zinc-finger